MTEVSQRWADLIARLLFLVRLERVLLRNVLSFAAVIAVLSLIVPLTVQELTSTFAYAVQPIMIWTLIPVMAFILLVVGIFRALQFYATEMIERRLTARVALGMTEQLPLMNVSAFKPAYANRFIESVFLHRAISVLLVDGVNLCVGGAVSLTLLVYYHLYFAMYGAVLVGGVLFIVLALSAGGHRSTMAMSRSKYEMLGWLQDMAQNLLQFKVTDCRDALIRKTDALTQRYIEARQLRFRAVLRMYLAWVAWYAVTYSGAIGLGGWLVASGQLTIGQFVAVEVIVGTLLASLDSVLKRMPHAFYILTSVTELDMLFSTPHDQERGRQAVAIKDPKVHGLHLDCRNMGMADEDGTMLFARLDLEVRPASRIAIRAPSSNAQRALTRVLAGLVPPTTGSIRYNGISLRDLNPLDLRDAIGVVFDYQPTLLEGSLADNITMGRSGIDYHDLRWALGLVEMDEAVDSLPQGLRTPVRAMGKAFTTSLVHRILVARAIVGHPRLLLLEGTLPSIPLLLRDRILQRLALRERPWALICISCEPTLVPDADAQLVLD